MKINLLLVLIIVTFYFLPLHLEAQIKLSKNDLENIKTKSLEIISDFDDYLRRIASKDNVEEPDKYLLIKQASGYFVDSSTVEVSNKITKHIATYNVNNYLIDVVLKYKERYGIVEFQAIPIRNVQLTPDYDNNGNIVGYKGTVRYRQWFCAKKINNLEVRKEGQLVIKYDYCDITEKEAEIRVKKIETMDGKSIWLVKLGNIRVVSTTG